MTRIAAIVASAVVLAGLLGTYAWTQYARRDVASCSGGAVGGDIGGPFELVDQNGKTVTEAEVISEPALVYFGYTFCPDVCPFDVARNADAVDLLAERGMRVRPVFISVDPARDTPEALGYFADAMHERMIALTGSDAQVEAASDAYRTYYRVHPAEDEFYLVDHSTFTYLMLPETGFAEFFRREVSAEDMAERVACHLGA